MMIQVEGGLYSLSYTELRVEYQLLCSLSDKEFLETRNLIRAAHLACIVGWLKEIPPDGTIGDRGIVHELIHLLSGEETTTTCLHDIRRQFVTSLLLAP